MSIKVSCSVCGKEFLKKRSRVFKNNYCSNECWKVGRETIAGGVAAICAHCGKKIHIPPSRYARSKSKLFACSTEHRGLMYRGEINALYKGRGKNRAGYFIIRDHEIPEKYRSMVTRGKAVLEHRLIVAQHLGRPLESWEVVHHKNGVKDDNRIENLELHPAFEHSGISVVEHKRIADLERRVKELEQENDNLRQLAKKGKR